MKEHPILLFDGVCNLCNGFVQWLIRRDPQAVFRFASLQSAAGQALLQRYDLPQDEISTVVLIEDQQCYTHSDVALRIVRRLSGGWPLLSVLRFIPKSIRDGIYNWIARHRYQWFGQQESCMIPTPALRERFLD